MTSVAECQEKMDHFNSFRSDEFPPKLAEKGDLEAHYSTLQTKLRLSGRPPYVPSEGKMIADINNAWGGLESADKDNKAWVLSELKRNQICEQKYASFLSKADGHEGWTTGKDKTLATDDYSTANLGGVLALIKRHEAFQSDLMVCFITRREEEGEEEEEEEAEEEEEEEERRRECVCAVFSGGGVFRAHTVILFLVPVSTSSSLCLFSFSLFIIIF